MLRVDVRDEDGGERGLERAFRRRSVWSGRVTDAPRARLSGIEEFARRVCRVRIALPRDDESILPVSQ